MRYHVIEVCMFQLLESTVIFSSFAISLVNILGESETHFVKTNRKADIWISLVAYYASTTEPLASSPTKTYFESPNSPAMSWYGIKVLQQTINYINLGYTSLTEADQPLSTLAKKLQWKYSKSMVNTPIK